MQSKQVATIAVLLVVIASLSVAGCTVNLPGASSPTPQPTATPAVSPSPTTAVSTPQASGTLGVNATIGILTKVLRDGGNTILEPFTGSTNSAGNTVLTVKYQTNTGQVQTEKVEMCKDSSAVDARFQATINDAKVQGYSGDIGTNGRWSGVNADDSKIILIGKANDLLQVTTIESTV